MSATKIQIGYGSDKRSPNPKGCYGKKSSGKVKMNGGFSGEAVSDFHKISEEDWDRCFPNSFKPSWMKNE